MRRIKFLKYINKSAAKANLGEINIFLIQN